MLHCWLSPHARRQIGSSRMARERWSDEDIREYDELMAIVVDLEYRSDRMRQEALETARDAAVIVDKYKTVKVTT